MWIFSIYTLTKPNLSQSQSMPTSASTTTILPSAFQIESLKVLSDFSFSLTNYTQLKVV